MWHNIQNKGDFFGADINFNFDGEKKISSFPGFIISILLSVVFMIYALKKIQVFMFRQNPNVTEILIPSYFDASTLLNLN